MKRLMIKVTGRVQGVGFRWFVKQRALQMDLTGWVQNQWDGSVIMEVQGETDTLTIFQNALRSHHPHANVESLLAEPMKVKDDEKTFYIRG